MYRTGCRIHHYLCNNKSDCMLFFQFGVKYQIWTWIFTFSSKSSMMPGFRYFSYLPRGLSPRFRHVCPFVWTPRDTLSPATGSSPPSTSSPPSPSPVFVAKICIQEDGGQKKELVATLPVFAKALAVASSALPATPSPLSPSPAFVAKICIYGDGGQKEEFVASVPILAEALATVFDREIGGEHDKKASKVEKLG